MSLDPLPAPARCGRQRKLVCLLLLAGAGIAAAWCGRAALYRTADPSRFDSTPLPRPRIDAPYIQTPGQIAERMIQLASIQKNDIVYDLGCGDGRLVIEAAVQSGCHGVGFDKDPQRVAEARENAKQHKVEELVQIEERDVFTVDLSKANVVVMYLLPWMLKALIPQFDAMPPGSRIVSHDFRIDGIEPDKIVEVDTDPYETRYLILYVTPLRRSPAPNKTYPRKS